MDCAIRTFFRNTASSHLSLQHDVELTYHIDWNITGVNFVIKPRVISCNRQRLSTSSVATDSSFVSVLESHRFPVQNLPPLYDHAISCH